MSQRIRIQTANRNPDNEVRVTFPNGHFVFIKKEWLIPLSNRVIDFIEYGEKANDDAG